MQAVSDRPPVTEIEDEILSEGGNEEDERFGYGYYRLKGGWITYGRADPSSVESYRKKGMTPLIERFGRFVLNPGIVKDRKGNPLPQWQPYFQPYDRLLLEAPEEFPVEQVVAYHWHRGFKAYWVEYLADGRYREHRRTITFPQLAGLTIPDYFCEVCGRVFNAPEHVNIHVRMAHPERGTLLQLAETQRAIATAIGTAQNGGDGSALLAQAISQIAQVQTQMGETIARLTSERSPSAVVKKPRSDKQIAHAQRLAAMAQARRTGGSSPADGADKGVTDEANDDDDPQLSGSTDRFSS